MSTQYIQLKNPSGDLLYPRTDWRVILNRPSFATSEQVNAKQDKLTSANSGDNILIETINGQVRISATAVSNYINLSNKPTINGVTINGSLSLAQLGIPYVSDSTEAAFELSDQYGNVALQITNEGHLITKRFNSENLPTRLSQFNNDSNFINTNQANALIAAAHDSTKQDTLSSLNAGVGISITSQVHGAGYISVINVQPSAISYANLSDQPTLGGVRIVGSKGYGDFSLVYYGDGLLSDSALEISDGSDHVALAVTNTGHIRTKNFDSEDVLNRLAILEQRI